MATIDSLQQDRRAPEARKAGVSGLGWAWLSSCALLAGGTVLALAPHALPATGPAIANLARVGLTWPLVAGFGLVLAAVAAATRRPREGVDSLPVEAPAPEPVPVPVATLSQDPLARDIAGELARVRGSLHDLRIEFVYVKDTLARIQQATSQTDPDAGRDSEAAIFRLAASLDQLGGRIEHELSAQRVWIGEALESQARRPITEASSLPRFADPYVQAFEGPAHEIDVDEGFVAADEDLHVEVSLEDEVSWRNGLGVLDEIDEPRGPIAQGKTSHSGRPSSADALLGELEQAGSERAELDAKMARLRDLLSDPVVQRALESQSR
ncbi:MAG: hypothetical protein NTY35_14270 [Planctomycetota bacterium]|nr:hypothetical protein [Planctomycetota bacterium]